jgi:hypothetical protein
MNDETFLVNLRNNYYYVSADFETLITFSDNNDREKQDEDSLFRGSLV